MADGATGACWTNLKDVREYAEEKLRMKGVKIFGQNHEMNPGKDYILEISVNAARLYNDGSVPCIGNARAPSYTEPYIEGKLLLAEIATNGAINAEKQNFNRQAIEETTQVIDELQRQ